MQVNEIPAQRRVGSVLVILLDVDCNLKPKANQRISVNVLLHLSIAGTQQRSQLRVHVTFVHARVD